MQERKVFCDTNILLSDKFNLNDYDKVFISVVSLEEIDGLKKDDNVGYKARRIIKELKNANNIEYVLYEQNNLIAFLEHKNDNKILQMAYDTWQEDNEIQFLTDDFNLYIKAKAIKLPCQMFEYKECEIEYVGYKEVTLKDYEMSLHYQCPTNKWGLLHNEYLVLKDTEGEIVDRQRWTDNKGFCSISYKPFKSIYFGDIKPKDVYQMFAMDALYNSQFVMLSGYAGTAKTLLSLSWIMQNIQTGKIGKVVIIFNPAKLKNSEQLGYYSGSRIEKLMQNSIGGILSSKLGDMTMVETLIAQGKIMIIPTSDIRGIEISDNDCLFVSEAQNTDIYTMKTILQRAKEGCKIIIEGDIEEQQDIRCGKSQNGMTRALEIFRGCKYFSYVRLQNTYRSPIAEIAQNM